MTICMRYTKNEQDAVEVLNSGFLKVFRNINKYNSEKGGLYTWISTIVINTCLDFIKSKARRESYTGLHDAADIEIPAEITSKMSARDLLSLVRGLPPATQGVFNLYVVEGYNHKDISRMLGISEGTSKWHLSEGRKALQQMIQIQEIKAHG